MIAAFDEQYAGEFGAPTSPYVDAILTIRPSPCARKWGRDFGAVSAVAAHSVVAVAVFAVGLVTFGALLMPAV
jgi:hypothetical protein